ncbi:hypothetical protein N5V81_13370 [Escherichia coli]|nr:hypothetical protein [Escherichia coli]
MKCTGHQNVAVKGTEKVMGLPIVQGDFPMTGPGPQELIRGDWHRGYFGTLTNEEFILNHAELNGLIGFNAWNQAQHYSINSFSKDAFCSFLTR